jgi:hypothetical protein
MPTTRQQESLQETTLARDPVKAKEDTAIASISLTNAITLLALILNLAVGSLIGVYQLYVIPSIKNNLEVQLDIVKRRADETEKQSLSRIDDLKTQVLQLEDTRSKAFEQNNRPLLLFPKNDEITISNEITFRWDYKSDKDAQYIIEISKASQDGIRTSTYSVLQPDKRIFHLPVGTFGTGQYLWRVRPGVVQEGREVSTGPWSAYQSFSVYTSVLEKVLRTRRLTVGMYASFFDRFNSPVAGGKFEGFSVDFARYMATMMTTNERLSDATKQVPVVAEFVSMAWQDLFDTLKSGRVDIIVSSVTATKQRESDHGILFSRGYFVTDQLFLSRTLDYNKMKSLQENIRGQKNRSRQGDYKREGCGLFHQKMQLQSNGYCYILATDRGKESIISRGR